MLFRDQKSGALGNYTHADLVFYGSFPHAFFSKSSRGIATMAADCADILAIWTDLLGVLLSAVLRSSVKSLFFRLSAKRSYVLFFYLISFFSNYTSAIKINSLVCLSFKSSGFLPPLH